MNTLDLLLESIDSVASSDDRMEKCLLSNSNYLIIYNYNKEYYR